MPPAHSSQHFVSFPLPTSQFKHRQCSNDQERFLESKQKVISLSYLLNYLSLCIWRSSFYRPCFRARNEVRLRQIFYRKRISRDIISHRPGSISNCLTYTDVSCSTKRQKCRHSGYVNKPVIPFLRVSKFKDDIQKKKKQFNLCRKG